VRRRLLIHKFGLNVTYVAKRKRDIYIKEKMTKD